MKYQCCVLQVPGLYTPEELDPLLMPLREQAAHEDFRGSQFTYFASRKWLNIFPRTWLLMEHWFPELVKSCVDKAGEVTCRSQVI